MKTFHQYRYVLYGIVAFLVILRFFHLDSEVDDPHAWRQYDTKQYIEGYYYDDVPFLEPTVCWMGQHKTLILEFPLPEYMVAQLFKVFGPNLVVARLFFLTFFVLAILYFYKSLRLVFDNYVPELATFFAGVVPLSLFYSRAIHIDFFVISLGMSMLYFSMKAIRNQHFASLLIAVACGSLGMLIKAPYIFYLALPILFFAYTEGRFKWLIIRAPLFLISGILLFFWIQYSHRVNAQIPDWDYIPNFNKFTDMSYWYFGTLQQRSVGNNWILIGERIFDEILRAAGTFLAIIGLLFYRKNAAFKWSFLLLLGTILYVVIFFNLNVKHNYYQLPFVLCCALFMAMGVQWTVDRLPSTKASKNVLLFLLPALVLFEGMQYAETNYYTKHTESRKVAEEIRKFTDRDDGVIVCYGGLTPQCPLILQEAQRYGWSIPINDFTPEIAHKLYKEGRATKFAIYIGGYFPEGDLRSFYEYMIVKKSVQITDEGMVLYMCDLDFSQR
ncbi:MAG: glycosyltransferase family 39 protein [bacterium]|nr:glycosyltransferase family 39 protein [bacterium]